jgi:hypothetical protein
VLALVLVGVAAAPAIAHEGDARYRSVVREIAPPVSGLSVRVTNFDDGLALVNESGETVVVEGYDGEPYARVAADGTVAVNRRSPAAYLNDDRYARSGVPAAVRAEPSRAPRWDVLDETGRFAWHDHRMHWMARGLPPQVDDESQGRTRVFDYSIPLQVGGRAASIEGTLWWVGEREGGGLPVAALVSLPVLALLAAGAVVLVRRRRRGTGARTAW